MTKTKNYDYKKISLKIIQGKKQSHPGLLVRMSNDMRSVFWGRGVGIRFG